MAERHPRGASRSGRSRARRAPRGSLSARSPSRGARLGARRDGRVANPLDTLEWRGIGPYRGGRVVAVAGDPAHREIFYFGSTGGGVWKTTDGGIFWENVSDGYFRRASVGAIAVAASDPNVVYVGMGEATIRGNVSHGDGVYRSTDAGKTWTHLGLADTRNIGKVRVHPRDPDVVYVAALGHAHGPNEERGVFRTTDAGKTWRRVLHRDRDTGAIDLSIDPNNPRVIYATLWQARRNPWSLTSGGSGSGIFKSADGGDTWSEISRNPGLPKGVLGKIGISVSPARADRVYAIVEAADGAVFRSDDAGATWERLSEDRNLRQRAWYYHHIHADPQDPDTVWVLNVEAWRSVDAGQTFKEFPIPHGDNHDLWIDPRHTDRMIEGNDGGACVTFNGGESWSTIYNQPTCEFYHVTTDTQIPYRVYGAQQDNTTISVPSRSRLMSITREDAIEIGGGESGYIAVRPDDPNVIFAGSYQGHLTRYDHRTGQSRNIMVWPEFSSGWGAKDTKYRFQWTFPIVISPHDPNDVYVTGNHVFRSRDEGVTWERISPDLTRNDHSKMDPSGGPITKDNTGAEYYGTIFAFAESPLARGLLWAGSDDGLVHVSRDGGSSWKNVTPRELKPWTLVSIIEASPHDPAVAYVAATRYKLDDFGPYLFRTADYGRTWTKITNGIPADDFTRVVREDPKRPGLLYAGTETGLYVSFDSGGRWQRWQGKKFPVVPIHDLAVKDDDLVVGTHGRAFWVFDDLTPVRELAAATRERAHVFEPLPTIRFRTNRGFGFRPKVGKNYRFTGATMVVQRIEKKPDTDELVEFNLDTGTNPKDGVLVTYWLRETPAGELTLSFLDARGHEIRTFSSKRERKEDTAGVTATPAEGAEAAAEVREPVPEEEEKEPRVPKEAGLNRFVWDMRYPPATKVAGDVSMEEFERALAGPLVPPGRYRVRLRGSGIAATTSFEIHKDPRVAATQEDLEAQTALLLDIRDRLSAAHDAVNRIRSVRRQVDEWERRAKERKDLAPVARAAATLKRKLGQVEDELIQSKAKSRQDTLNFPIKLNAKLGGLVGAVGGADAAPTNPARACFDELSARIEKQLERLARIVDEDLAGFDSLVRRSKATAVSVATAAATD